VDLDPVEDLPMRALLCAAVLAAGSGPQTLDLREGTLTYRVIHKLHEVKGVTHALEGRAQVRPGGALRVQVRAKIATFDSGNSSRDEHVREVTHEPAHPYVQLKGTAQGVQLPISTPTDVTLDATVDLNGVQKPQQIAVRLVPQPRGVRARFSFPISLEAFQVERPELLFVKVEDQAQIEGDLVFSEGQQ
jgi:polyisoprenoid-binding protein YceI